MYKTICICNFCPVFALTEFMYIVYEYTQAHIQYHMCCHVVISSASSISLSSFLVHIQYSDLYVVPQ